MKACPHLLRLLLTLAIAAVIKGQRWQRAAGLVAVLPALAVCTLNWMITF
jgi:hypothetical protein